MRKLLTIATAAAFSLSASAATNNLTLKADKPGAPIQPTMYGLFFEDINFGATAASMPRR